MLEAESWQQSTDNGYRIENLSELKVESWKLRISWKLTTDNGYRIENLNELKIESWKLKFNLSSTTVIELMPWRYEGEVESKS